MPPTISEALIEAYLENLQVIPINALPPDQKTCPVCQDPYLSQPLLERPVRINSLHPNSICRHVFGRRCIEMHMRAGEPWSVRCPICREDWFMVHDGGATAAVTPLSPVVPRQVAVRPPLRLAAPRPTAPRPAVPRPVDSDVDDDDNDGSDNEDFDDQDDDDEVFHDDEDSEDEDYDEEDYNDEDRRWRVSRRGRLIRYMGFMDRMLGQLNRVGRANSDGELSFHIR